MNVLPIKLYKLTDEDGYTRRGCDNETLWSEGIEHTAKGTGGLCTDGVIHAYRHPLLAVLLNPCHANIRSPILWECEGYDIVVEKGDKCGVKKLKTVKTLTLPVISIEQLVRFAIGCALEVYKDAKFKIWALDWLSSKDKSANTAADAAKNAAVKNTAAYAAADAAYIATYAANVANTAAHAAAYAAANAAAYTPLSAAALLRIAEWAITNNNYDKLRS